MLLGFGISFIIATVRGGHSLQVCGQRFVGIENKACKILLVLSSLSSLISPIIVYFLGFFSVLQLLF